MRKVCGIVFLVIAGLFFFTVCQFGIAVADADITAVILGVFTVLGMIPLLIGLAFMGWRRWKHDTGVVLLSVAGCSAFSLFSMVCIMMDDSFLAMLGDTVPVGSFSYTTSGVLIAIYAGLGWWLYKSDTVVVSVNG